MNNMTQENQNKPPGQQVKEQQQDRAEEYLTNWKRTQADFDNYRKEEARRVQEVVRYGTEKIILDVIDALDGLESAMQHAPPNINEQWFTGLRQSIDRIHLMLKKFGVERIIAVGQPFDPLLHEAVQVDNKQESSQAVLEEYRTGYMMHDKVIRPARVKISK